MRALLATLHVALPDPLPLKQVLSRRRHAQRSLNGANQRSSTVADPLMARKPAAGDEQLSMVYTLCSLDGHLASREAPTGSVDKASLHSLTLAIGPAFSA
jgi:hypothetical protein